VSAADLALALLAAVVVFAVTASGFGSDPLGRSDGRPPVASVRLILDDRVSATDRYLSPVDAKARATALGQIASSDSVRRAVADRLDKPGEVIIFPAVPVASSPVPDTADAAIELAVLPIGETGVLEVNARATDRTASRRALEAYLAILQRTQDPTSSSTRGSSPFRFLGDIRVEDVPPARPPWLQAIGLAGLTFALVLAIRNARNARGAVASMRDESIRRTGIV